MAFGSNGLISSVHHLVWDVDDGVYDDDKDYDVHDNVLV